VDCIRGRGLGALDKGGTTSSADIKNFQGLTGGEFNENVSAQDSRHSEMLFVQTDLFFLVIWERIRVSNYPMMSMQNSSTPFIYDLRQPVPGPGVQSGVIRRKPHIVARKGGFECSGVQGIPPCSTMCVNIVTTRNARHITRVIGVHPRIVRILHTNKLIVRQRQSQAAAVGKAVGA